MAYAQRMPATAYKKAGHKSATERTSDGKPDVKGVPISDNSFEVTDGTFKGWSLAYCKGPDGEQLEFNQVKEEAKKDFDEALVKYLSGGTNVQ